MSNTLIIQEFIFPNLCELQHSANFAASNLTEKMLGGGGRETRVGFRNGTKWIQILPEARGSCTWM